MQDHPEILFRFVRRAATFLGVVLWVFASLLALDLLEKAAETARRVFAAKASIGSFEISVAGVLLAILVGIVTLLILRLTRFALEREVMPRLHVGKGKAFVVSVLVRYVLALIGFLLIVSALGIDLTKVTVLIGALGVGLGFGLQNIVNNFVSGLILLFEQPVKVDDTVMLDTIGGKVQHIGVRATTIRTFDGADVVVPNSELISKNLINWSLSDQKRRAEVTVGAAHGTDVEQVFALLLRVAREHPKVTAEPAPFALFVGFGDSSLDFKLYAWVADGGTALQVASEIRTAILREFGKAGIEIPFPQRDLHVRSSDLALGLDATRNG